jgi:hypothetical protein
VLNRMDRRNLTIDSETNPEVGKMSVPASISDLRRTGHTQQA